MQPHADDKAANINHEFLLYGFYILISSASIKAICNDIGTPIITAAYGGYHPSFLPKSGLKPLIFAIYCENHAPFSGIVGNVQRFDGRLQTERIFFLTGKANADESA